LLVVVGVWGCLDGWGLWSDMASPDGSMGTTKAGKAGMRRKEDGVGQGGAAVGGTGEGGWKGRSSREGSSAKKNGRNGGQYLGYAG
jgi:hypothetical protein